MGSRCECGAELSEGQAFCRVCGRPRTASRASAGETASREGRGSSSGISARAVLGFGAVLLLALVGAGFALSSLNDNSEDQDDGSEAVARVDGANERRLEQEVSELKDEVEELRETQNAQPPAVQPVEPSDPPEPSPSKGGALIGYVAQLGSHRGLSEAEAQQMSLRAAGLDAGILWSSYFPQMVPRYWVVYLGPFDSQTAADQAAGSSGVSDAFGRYISPG